MRDLLSSQEAADLLGIKLDTLYVYVSRKGIRSVPSADKAKRLYWRADVERARRGSKRRQSAGDSALTLYTEADLYYRGHSVRALTETASFEQVAALLWGVREHEVFTKHLPAMTVSARAVAKTLKAESAVTKAACIFPLIEAANPRAFDLSALGMARSGADVLRCLCAITLGGLSPVADPIAHVFAKRLGLSPEQSDLVRRLLILSADHGLESATFAVRSVASTGVSPWRLVPAGISVTMGRHSRFGHFGRVERIVAEIIENDSPADPVLRRMQDGEAVPGFQDAKAFQGDARVRILHERLRVIMSSDAGFQKLDRAADIVRDRLDLHPTFAYFSTFAWRKVGMHRHEGPFMLGRSAGWIGHAIEQFQAGERERAELHYRGPLPALHSG